MTGFKCESAIEALADAWASLEGKKDKFRAGKGQPWHEDIDGYYPNYMGEAAELAKRLGARGYIIVEKADG